MKNILLTIAFFSFLSQNHAQTKKAGRVVVEKILFSSLKENQAGEDPSRSVTVYLPTGYDEGNQRYPVIYYLHGFQMNDSMFIEGAHVDKMMDKAIATGKIHPAIFVIPNEYTLFQGSFYTNSIATGNWEDFTAGELVKYIDKKYRTIPNRNSRGLAGISMGGYGAIKLGMKHADVFGCVYAQSAAVLGMNQDYNIYHPSLKIAQQAKNKEELFKDEYATTFIALGRAFSPNPHKPPFYCDLPVSYIGDRMVVNEDVLSKWEKNSPLNMIDEHISDLKSLNGIRLDWGRNDEFAHIPVTNLLFSQKLESLGIQHEAECYYGDHSHEVWEFSGRLYNELIPFFDRHLQFDDGSDHREYTGLSGMILQF